MSHRDDLHHMERARRLQAIEESKDEAFVGWWALGITMVVVGGFFVGSMYYFLTRVVGLRW